MDAADKKANEMIVAGALYMALQTAQSHHQFWAKPETDSMGLGTGKLIVSFPFMRNSYRISVETIPEEEPF